MAILTDLEEKVLLRLFKAPLEHYNSSNLGQDLGVARSGVYDLLERFKAEGILLSHTIGKSVVYNINFEEERVSLFMAYLLAEEATKHNRWRKELADFSEHSEIVLLYGSILKNTKQANDIDIMLVTSQENVGAINKIVDEKNKILVKPLHAIKLTLNDLQKNIAKGDKVIIDVVKNAVVMHGHAAYVEVLKNVTRIP